MASTTDQQLTTLSSSSSLTVPVEAEAMYVQAETQNVRFRCDGTAPTASVGVILYAGDAPLLIVGRQAMANFRAIEVTASAKLNVSYLLA